MSSCVLAPRVNAEHAPVAEVRLVLLQEGQHRLDVGSHRVAAARRLRGADEEQALNEDALSHGNFAAQ